WDDTLPNWDSLQCLLVIQGHAITLKYWPSIYSCGRPGEWESKKRKWGEWMYIATCWHHSSPENFWQEFSDDNGQRLQYMDIVSVLHKQCQERDT
ncbi:hypothetical protein P691DRAFT_649664, partial [Macrolepiota fuliginosa MF-IS2]